MTQYFRLNAGTEFAFGAGLRAIIRRQDYSGSDSNPFECLLDQSCQISKRNEKNHVSLNVVLTSGDYLLQFFDDSDYQYAQWISQDLGLERVPIMLDLDSFPIL